MPTHQDGRSEPIIDRPTGDVGRWLIDGNNVMGSRPDGWWRDRVAAKAGLAARVAAWRAARERSVVLVFDGRADPRIEGSAGTDLDLRFAPGGRPDAADDLLVEAAEPGDTVVTADRGLAGRLGDGITVVGPSRLLAELDELDELGAAATADEASVPSTRRPAGN